MTTWRQPDSKMQTQQRDCQSHACERMDAVAAAVAEAARACEVGGEKTFAVYNKSVVAHLCTFGEALQSNNAVTASQDPARAASNNGVVSNRQAFPLRVCTISTAACVGSAFASSNFVSRPKVCGSAAAATSGVCPSRFRPNFTSTLCDSSKSTIEGRACSTAATSAPTASSELPRLCLPSNFWFASSTEAAS